LRPDASNGKSLLTLVVQNESATAHYIQKEFIMSTSHRTTVRPAEAQAFDTLQDVLHFFTDATSQQVELNATLVELSQRKRAIADKWLKPIAEALATDEPLVKGIEYSYGRPERNDVPHRPIQGSCDAGLRFHAGVDAEGNIYLETGMSIPKKVRQLPGFKSDDMRCTHSIGGNQMVSADGEKQLRKMGIKFTKRPNPDRGYREGLDQFVIDPAQPGFFQKIETLLFEKRKTHVAAGAGASLKGNHLENAVKAQINEELFGGLVTSKGMALKG
jgi:hypothetical protein